MVTRGYPSMSFLHSAAVAIKARADEGQHTHIYFFGDRDPSGVDIDRSVRKGIGESLAAIKGWSDVAEDLEEVFDIYADFERVAVAEEQIEDWELPTRPTKSSDTRSKNFEGDSVELDAVPADLLRELARECIEQHVDSHQLSVLQKTEEEERRQLLEMVETFNGGAS
jgi:hypothetical protein